MKKIVLCLTLCLTLVLSTSICFASDTSEKGGFFVDGEAISYELYFDDDDVYCEMYTDGTDVDTLWVTLRFYDSNDNKLFDCDSAASNGDYVEAVMDTEDIKDILDLSYVEVILYARFNDDSKTVPGGPIYYY